MAGIYVHIPFCHAKCAYCDFFSTPHLQRAELTADAIIAEYAARRHELGDHAISSIYFGGGTPSCLPLPLLRRICLALPMKEAVERTIEVNPEDVTEENAPAWRALGFNRVSMGVQSLVDSELQCVGRRHSADEALTAITALRAAGFANISCDLIYGLPGQTLDTWRFSLERLLSTGIEHLSAYALSYEPGTRLSAMLSAGKIEPTDDDTVADMYQLLCRHASAKGFEHYEISNFAKTGFRSLHNSSYWTSSPYLGLGPGAHSCDAEGIRRAAPNNIDKWIEQGAQIDEEDDIDRLNDKIITGLRTSEGLDLSVFSSLQSDGLLTRAGSHIGCGHLIRTGNRLVIPEEYWLLSDAIMRDLMIE